MTATMRAEDVAEPDYDPDYDLPEHEPEPQEQACGTSLKSDTAEPEPPDLDANMNEVAAPGEGWSGAALALTLKTQEILARTAHLVERPQGPSSVALTDEPAANEDEPQWLPHVQAAARIAEATRSAEPTLASPREESESSEQPPAAGGDDPDVLLARRVNWHRADTKARQIVAAEENAREEAERLGGRNTWAAEDINDILDGNREPVVAELGHRTDGVPILYRGKEHGVAGEPESGKTWFALMIVAQVLKKGGRVTYVDFEDDARTVVGRLLDLGVLASRLRPDAGQFRYVRPEVAPKPGDIDAALTFPGGPADLAIYDGFTEGAALLGLDVTGGDGQAAVAKFRRAIIRPALTANAATLITDHVVKSSEGRNRYAIGAQHKLAGLTGAMFMIEVEKTWGRGRKGRSKIWVTKDRNAHLRENSEPDPRPNFDHFGDLVGNAEDGNGINVALFPAKPKDHASDEARDSGQPDPKFAKHVPNVEAALRAETKPLSTNQVYALAGGNKADVLLALEWLVVKGRVVRTKEGQSNMHALPSLVQAETTDLPGPGSEPVPTGSEN